jgi:hypothetical protein
LLRGELDLETGELAHAVLTAMTAVDPDNPEDTAAAEKLRASGWEFGDPLPEGVDPTGRPWDRPRSRARKLHDALKLALRTCSTAVHWACATRSPPTSASRST